MNRLVTILIFDLLVICGCKSFETNSFDIDGNWGLSSNSISQSFNYQEILFKKGLMYRHNFVGDLPSLKYYIEKDTLLLQDFATEQKSSVGKIEMKGDSLSIINKKGIIVYYRIIDNKNLQQYLEGKINYEKYRMAFSKRETIRQK